MEEKTLSKSVKSMNSRNYQDNGFDLGLSEIKTSLRARIKSYKKRAEEIEAYLYEHPDEWGKFQSEFNYAVNAIFREIMLFEKSNIAKGQIDKVTKLRHLFMNRLRNLFVKGPCIEWGTRKPFGYAGDFKIIDDIYQNNPLSTGFERLFDNYFLMSTISIAVRNRKDDFRRLILNFANNKKRTPVRIMDLASGPCREIREIFSYNLLTNKNVIFDCYDNEGKAIEYAKKILNDCSNVNFVRENILRLAATKNISVIIKPRYDFIYATGLFDYFKHKISVKLIHNLKQLLNSDGVIAIANVRDKYSNPSMHWMEWVGDWNLTYRGDDEFKQIFLDAGFKEDALKIQYEQQGVIQYVIATKREK